MKQLLMGASSAAMSAAAARYGQLDGADNWDSTIGDRVTLIAEAGTLSFLRVDLLSAPGAGKSLTFAVLLNGVAQSLSVAITESSTSGEDVLNSVAVVAGDRVTLRVTPAGTPTTSLARWSLQFEATEANRAIWGTDNDNALNTSSTTYNAIGANGLNTWSTTETDNSVLWAVACSIKKFYVNLSAGPGAGGDTYTFKIVVNGTPVEASAIAIVDAATSGNVTSLNIAISPGDLVSIECTPSGTPTNPSAEWGISYAPSTDHQFNISEGRIATPTDDGFIYINSQNTIIDATENNRIMVPGGATGAVAPRILAMYMLCSVAPGPGTSRSATLRKNGADTSLVTTVSNNNTTDSKQGSITIANGDDFVFQLNNTGSPAAGSVKLALRFGFPGGSGPPGGGGGPRRPPGPPPGGGGSGLTGGKALRKLRFPEKVI